MNYGLLWIDMLTASLLWVAAGSAFVSHLARVWVRIVFWAVVAAIPLTGLGWFLYAATMARFRYKLETNWFVYALVLVLAYGVGAWLVLRAALRREPGTGPAAAYWKSAPLALGCLIAVAVGYMAIWNMDMAIRARCAIESDRIDALYLATMPPVVSEDQNAAPIYKKIMAKLKNDPGIMKDIQNPPIGRNSEFDGNEPATLAFLDRQASTIALLQQAAALPSCRFDEDLTGMDVDARGTMMNEERIMALTLNLHALEEISRGHASSAILDAATMYRMGHQLGERPGLTSALLGFGFCGMGNRTLEEALPAVKNRNELASLRFEDFPPLAEMFQRALWGEEVYDLTIVDRMPTSDFQAMASGLLVGSTSGGPMGVEPMRIFQRVFFLDADAYLAGVSRRQTWATQPYYEIRDLLPAPRDNPWLNPPSASVLVGNGRPFESLAMHEAEDSCAMTGVAMTRYRFDHGTMPARLDDLVPDYMDEIPTDPYNGQPIKLAVKPDRWIVYSVGPDGIDDSGADYVNGKGDITFTLRPTSAETATKP